MFVCKDCHDERCQLGFIEEMSGSYGRCEGCGKVTGCLDCHGYKRLPPPVRKPEPPKHTCLRATPRDVIQASLEASASPVVVERAQGLARLIVGDLTVAGFKFSTAACEACDQGVPGGRDD